MKKHRFLSAFLVLALCLSMLPTSAIAAVTEEPAGVWKVGTNAELNDAVKEIEAKRDAGTLTDNKATIALTADIKLQCLNPDDDNATYCGDNYFAGIEGVELTLTSDGKAEGEAGYKLENFGLRLGNYDENAGFGNPNDRSEKLRFMVGPVIFDQINLVSDDMWLFAQGHHVVFTKNFRNSCTHQSTSDEGAISVVGGMLGKQYRQMGTGFESYNNPGLNNDGTPSALKSLTGSMKTDEFGWIPNCATFVKGTNVELYGGYFGTIVGGSYNGYVLGDTHVTVALDPDEIYDFKNIHNVGQIFGGNMLNGKPDSAYGDNRAAVYGDTYVNAYSATFSDIYGGSSAHFNKNTDDDKGVIMGDTHVTLGQASGMEARYSDVYAGGLRSSIGARVNIPGKGYQGIGGNTHLTVNNTAVGGGTSDLHGGGDMDLIWGTTEVVLNGGKNAHWIFAGGSNSTYDKKARILNMVPEAGKDAPPKTAAHIVVNGGNWNQIYSCVETFSGSNQADNTQWIRGDVVVDFNGGKVKSFCLSGPRTAIGLSNSDYVSDYWGGEIGTSMQTDADSILNVYGGQFGSSVPTIMGYRYGDHHNNEDQWGKVVGGKRIVNFLNDKPVATWEIDSIDLIHVNNTAPVAVKWWNNGGDMYPALDNCTDVDIEKGTLALAGENTIKGNLSIQDGGVLALPTAKTFTDAPQNVPNGVLNCEGNASGVDGGLATIDVAKDGSYWLIPNNKLVRPTEGEVYVRANALGTDTETGNTSNKDSLMLNLVNSEPDLYVEYTTDQAATTNHYKHAWRIAKDANVEIAKVKYNKYQVTLGDKTTWISNNTDQSVAIGKTVGKLPADPTRSGYAFNGWTLTEDGSGAAFTADTVISKDLLQNNVVNVYGQWRPIVTFDANGGAWDNNVTGKKVTADKSGKVQAPADPSINGGKEFAGWFTEKTGGTKVDLSKETFTKPTTLYAQWKEHETVTITYSPQGVPEGVDVPPVATIDKGDAYTSEKPNKVDGWVFEGCYIDKELTIPFKDGTAITKDVTLYGKWVQTFTVTYTDGVDGEEVFADKVITDIKKGDATPAFGADPTRDGYTFTGWDPEVAQTVTQNVTYTAQWEKNTTPGPGPGPVVTKVTLHYESNGGTAYADESYDKGAVVTLDKHPIRAGYSFTGWYADKACTDKIDSITMTGNKTVYAGWEQTAVPPVFRDDHISYIVGFVDGEVKPLADITRSEVATIFYRLLDEEVRDANTTDQNSFSDVDGNAWYNVPASTMAAMGIVAGYPDGDFHGSDSITRAEFAAIAARFDAETDNTGAAFSDISGHWAEKDIVNAANKGWIMGYPDGTFRPNQTITRAEAMSLINRVLQRNPNTPNDLLEGMIEWPDNMDTEKWYYLPVQEATNSHDYARKDDGTETWTALNN